MAALLAAALATALPAAGARADAASAGFPDRFQPIKDWMMYTGSSATGPEDPINVAMFSPKSLNTDILHTTLNSMGWVDDAYLGHDALAVSLAYANLDDGKGYRQQEWTVTDDGDPFTHCTEMRPMPPVPRAGVPTPTPAPGPTPYDIVTGCKPRDHVRFWSNVVGTVNQFYAAASTEIWCRPPDHLYGFGYHCAPQGAYTDGRNQFETYARQVFERKGWEFRIYHLTNNPTGTAGWKSVHPVPTYVANGVLAPAVSDGNLTIFCVDPGSTGFCTRSPLSVGFAGDLAGGVELFKSGLALDPGKLSPVITARFLNQGYQPLTTQNTFLAAWGSGGNGPVSTPWCSGDATYYASCSAGSPTLVKLTGDCQTNQLCQFQYTIKAPAQYASGTMLRWRVVSKTGNSYQPLNDLSGSNPVEVYTVVQRSAGQPTDDHGVWVGDSYDGKPLNHTITLDPGQPSHPIYVSFRNEGPANWDSNTVLAYVGEHPAGQPPGDGPPADGTPFCHPAGGDWHSCNPGVPAWIGYATIPPGQVATFEFQIQAPDNLSASDSTLEFRPAERQGDGTYRWIDSQPADGLPDNKTYEYFTVHLNAGKCC